MMWPIRSLVESEVENVVDDEPLVSNTSGDVVDEATEPANDYSLNEPLLADA